VRERRVTTIGGRREPETAMSGGGDVGGRDRLVEVATTSSASEETVVRSILDGAGIRYVVTDPARPGLLGWTRIVVGPGSSIGPARFLVDPDDADAARALLSTNGDATPSP
jgi:hypothetical protein